MKSINKMKEIYKLGLRSAMDTSEGAGSVQVVYLALVIAEIATLWSVNYPNANIYTGMMILHLLSMYILGYLKEYGGDHIGSIHIGPILVDLGKRVNCLGIYMILNGAFVIVTIGITQSLMTLLLFIIPPLGAILIAGVWILGAKVIPIVTKSRKWLSDCYKKLKQEGFSPEEISIMICEEWLEHHKKTYLAIFYILAIMIVIIPVAFLPIFIVSKLAIVATFIICIPLIIVGEYNEIAFYDIWVL